MTAAFDAQSALSTFTTTNSFTHTPVGTPKGILVMIAENVGVANVISKITYGTVVVPQIAYVSLPGGAEPGGCYIHFLGGPGIPTGAQTVSITVDSGTTAKVAWCVSVTATRDRTAIAAVGSLANTSVANPSITLATKHDFAGFAAAVIASGQNAPASVTAGTNFTLLTQTTDFGNQSAVAERSNTLTAENVAVAFTQTADDAEMLAVAIGEGLALPEDVELQSVNRAAVW